LRTRMVWNWRPLHWGLLTAALAALPNPSRADETWKGTGADQKYSTSSNWVADGDSALSNGENVALVNSMLMTGEFTVTTLASEGVTRLVMDGGTFHANSSGRLLLSTDEITDQGSTSLFKVSTNADAVLEIDQLGCAGYDLCSPICLEHTQVEIVRGTYLTLDPVTTEERLTEWPSGTLDAREGGRYNAPVCTCPTCTCDPNCDSDPPDCHS
jgi:hypothetical protein